MTHLDKKVNWDLEDRGIQFKKKEKKERNEQCIAKNNEFTISIVHKQKYNTATGTLYCRGVMTSPWQPEMQEMSIYSVFFLPAPPVDAHSSRGRPLVGAEMHSEH